jgi:hypothetical protein
MPQKTFGELFMASRGKPIAYRDLTVHAAHELVLTSNAVLIVRFVRSNSGVRQALRLASKDVEMDFDGQLLKDAVLWTDTAPPAFRVGLAPKKQLGTVLAWNAWMRDGCMDAWIGNGGMLIEKTADGFRLRCSDGVGEPDFDDLVVDLAIRPSGTA